MDERLVKHYENTYDLGEAVAPLAPVPLVRYPTGRMEAAVAFLAPRVSGKDVLELGAGDGVLAESLRVAGCDYRAYTLSEYSAVRLARMHRSFNDDRHTVEMIDAEQPVVGRQFDVVILVAVIEHLIDPISALRATRDLLRPGGFVYIDTPNIAKWTKRVTLVLGRFPSTASTDEGLMTYGGEQTDLYDGGHLHYFTFRSLERLLLERCAFARVERVGYSPGCRMGPRIGTTLARWRPTLFSDVSVVAYA